MAWGDFFKSICSSVAGSDSEPGISRRDMLAGLGLVGTFAAVSPVLRIGEVAASTLDDEIQLAQWDGRGDGRGPPRQRPAPQRRGPPPGPGQRRGPPPRRSQQRFTRRQLEQRCREPSFRRHNPNTCRRVSGLRVQRGSCITLGPIQICE
jgi:hypothetical protein